ncbi:MAG: cyclic nucleotide-binding domain-containing protein [Proteobacteria bacterium]|nr:cyclic nucleotide-binding domain-containing protein [Pseudomonadota bacterium]
MPNSIPMDKIINILAAMIAAINNIRLYPPSSALIANSIDKAFNGIQNAITSNTPLLIAESEKSLLISGEPLSFKHQQFPQVASFRNILSDLRIKSIILKKETSPTEFRNLLYILSKNSDEVDLEGGIQKIAAGAGLSSISISPSLFIPETAQIQSSLLDSTDIDLIKSFLGERRIMETDFLRIGEKSSDSQWVNEFFKTGIQLIKRQGINLADSLLPDTISKMVQAFGRSTPRENWDRVSSSITRALSDNDKELLTVVMAKNQAGNLFDTLVKTLSDDQYVDFFSEINRINENHAYADKQLTTEESAQFASVMSLLKKNQKTRVLREEIKQKILTEKKRIALDKVHQQKGINKILQGDFMSLADPLIMESISGRIGFWFNSGKVDSAHNLINRIADGLLNESLKIRSLASSALLSIMETFISENKQDEINKLAHKLNLWIKFETEATFNFKAACKMLQSHTRQLIHNYQFSEANTILETFSFITDGRLRKNTEIKDIAARILSDIANEATFDLVFSEFRDNEKNEGKNAYYTLIRLSEISVIPLLDLLRTSEDMSQRVRTINALTEIGTPALPAIVLRLQQGSSWFYMRNLIKLLSDMGSEEHLDILRPLLKHKNEKVPKAALNCAFDIGGKERVKFFIQALAIPDDSIKRLAADLIGKTESDEGVFPLTQVLKAKAAESAEAKNELDLTICAALKRIGSKKAIPTLSSIVTQKGILGINSYGPELRQSASLTLKYLQSLPTKGAKDEAEKNKTDSNTKKSRTRGDAKTEDLLTADPARLEALVDEYVRQKNTAEAVRLLYRMTVKFAREKNFTKAEELREKLFEVDPMALNEIVKTGDVIEEEKNNAIINDYMNIWGNLYERLNNEEANDLFYSLKVAEYASDETIITQHQKNARLYFINRGQLKIVYTHGDNEFFLKMLGAGDIAGDDTFFAISVSTVSLITLSQVKVSYLDRDTLKNLCFKHPELEKKLMDYCALGDGINTLVTKTGLDRRQQKRLNLNGKTLVQLLDTHEKPIGKPFKGKLLDFSIGGISFMIKTTKKETARLLLGRKLNMAIAILTRSKPIEVAGVGTIISAREQKGTHFSLHLKFDMPIDDRTMIDITSYSIPA